MRIEYSGLVLRSRNTQYNSHDIIFIGRRIIFAELNVVEIVEFVVVDLARS